MNQQQLECFIHVAESLSFAQAAKELNVSQPAVSRQISSLEEELNTKLFHRTTRNVSLTSYGQAFLPDARDIRNRMIAAYVKIHQDKDTYVPVLSIGFANTADQDLITLVLEQCKNNLPDLHPFFQFQSRKRLLNMLLNDNLDAAFGFKEDFSNTTELTYLHLFSIDICCTISSAHPYAALQSLPLESLYSEKAIFCYITDLPSQVVNIQKQLEYRYTASNYYYTDNIPVTLAFLRAGFGYSILPDLQSDINPGIACIPLEGYPPLSYGVYYKKSRATNPLLKEFLTLLQMRY